MIIKKYLANSVDEALTLVKQELGPSHVILTTRQIEQKGFLGWFAAKKIEVTAAVEEEDLRAHTSGKLEKKEESTPFSNLAGNLKELKEMVQEPLPELEPQPEPNPAPTAAPASATYGDPRLQRRAAAAPAAVTTSAPFTEPRESSGMAALKQTSHKLVEQFSSTSELAAPTIEPPSPREEKKAPSLDALRSMIREEMQRAQKGSSVGALEDNDEETIGSVRFLMAKGVGRKKALAIEEKLDATMGKVDMSRPSPERTGRMNALLRELASSLKTTGAIQLRSGEPTLVALVGPTGVGKSTTLAKLAGQFRQQRKKVALISLDNVKLGAREQIEAVAREHALPVRTATTREQLQEAIAAFYDQDLVLIDTGGRSQYQITEVSTLGELLTSDPRIEIYLALSATTKDVDCMGIVKQFSRMPIKGLIFTKLDETIAFGGMVTVCEKSGHPIAYLTNGQKIPRDLEVANAEEIAKSILMQHNSAACSKLREMATA